MTRDQLTDEAEDMLFHTRGMSRREQAVALVNTLFWPELAEARAARVTVWNDAIEAASDRLCIAHNECCDPARYDRGDCCGRFIPVQAAIRELKDRAP